MKIKNILIFVVISLLFSSSVIDSAEFIPIHIINNASEDLSVNAEGVVSFSSTVPRDSSKTIIGVRGNTITITGKDTGMIYGHRRFFSESTWTVS